MKSLYDKAQARIKRIEDSLSHQPVYHYPGQKYHWVFGFTKEGKKVCLGPSHILLFLILHLALVNNLCLLSELFLHT